MKTVLNTQGEDITQAIIEAADCYDLEPTDLLALLYAESGLDPKAERWGSYTANAKQDIAKGNRDDLLWVINQSWPDISFGYSQRIVLYHELGDRSPSTENCLQVRSEVFADPIADIHAAAYRLTDCFSHWTCNGTILSAMIVYNAGSDRRSDADWMRMWQGNVANYQAALDWAEQYREDRDNMADTQDIHTVTISKPTVLAGLDLIWAKLDEIQQAMGAESYVGSIAEEAKQDGIVQIKRALGLQE